MLVEAYPQALTTADDVTGITPIRILLSRHDMNSRYEILNSIVKSEPLSTILASSLRIAGVDGSVPLHMACSSESIDSDTFQLLVNLCPEAVIQTDEDGYLPIHRLCQNSSLHETASVNILKIFIKINSHIGVDQFLHATDIDYLPIHVALLNDMSPEFCKALIDACPESVRITCGAGDLAIHAACESYLTEWKCDPTLRRRWRDDPCTLVKYLFEIFPESINVIGSNGATPIQCVSVPAEEEISECDDALERENLMLIKDLVDFLERQMGYASKALDLIIMNTLDTNGWFPLHHDNASLGAIKLLVKGNTTALRVIDKKLSFPLHIACEFSSTEVVQLLLELDDTLLDHRDKNQDSTLHYACRGGNCGAVKYLIERHVSSVSERNADGDLPFHLLCKAKEDKLDRESLEYVDTIWQLLLAYPMTVRSFD
jgi:ankyrin repeat protein